MSMRMLTLRLLFQRMQQQCSVLHSIPSVLQVKAVVCSATTPEVFLFSAVAQDEVRTHLWLKR